MIKIFKKNIEKFHFIRNYYQFKKLCDSDNRFSMLWKDRYPCLYDKTTTTPYDAHYTYHPAWAARIIEKTKPSYHIDLSSILYFSCMISACRPVYFCDYRPPDLVLTNLSISKVDICNLPFKNDSIPSLSCMHTLEHIGLGRYGDPISPIGDIIAINECKRVLALGGNFLFVVPVGKKAKIHYNAHRIYSYQLIMDMFDSYKLMDFSFISDSGQFIEHANFVDILTSNYGCGCFWFKKK